MMTTPGWRCIGFKLAKILTAAARNRIALFACLSVKNKENCHNQLKNVILLLFIFGYRKQ
jgi:hypothetical protein